MAVGVDVPNNPPDAQSTGSKLFQVALQFLPIVCPIATAFIVWLGNRKKDPNSELQKEKKRRELVETKMRFLVAKNKVLCRQEEIVKKITQEKNRLEIEKKDQHDKLQNERKQSKLVETKNHSLEDENKVLRKQEEIYKNIANKNDRNMQIVKELQRRKKIILKEARENTHGVIRSLEELRPLLKKRQHIYCHPFIHRSERHEIENKLLLIAYSKSYDKALGLYTGMQDIFENDTSCGGARNGGLMWVYMDFWKAQAELINLKSAAQEMKVEDDAIDFISSENK